MKAKTAHSQAASIDTVVADLKEQIGDFNSQFILCYASSQFDPDALCARLHKAFNVPTIGCTTAGEIVSGKMLDHSVVLMAMSNEIVADVQVEVLTNIATDPSAVDKAFAHFEKHYGASMQQLDPSKYVGVVLIDGLSHREEEVNERLGDLTNITFIGGSAGDDLAFKQTTVWANGQAFRNAAVLALIKTSTPFDIIKTQSFEATGKKLTVTKSDEKSRTVIEFNGRPAAEEYAKQLGVPVDKLPESFATHPVGLGFGNDFFVRSPRQLSGSNIVFYCNIKEGMTLDILQSKDIIASTENALNKKLSTLGGISALVNFNCILRTLELKRKNQTKAYGELFSSIPTVGFSSYGESYIGHINQTATMLVFK